MINSIYLDKNNLKEIEREFSKAKMVRLDGFIEENLYEKLKKEVKKSLAHEKKIPDKFSFSSLEISRLTKQILDSEEMNYILENITCEKIKSVKIEARKFSHKDYTLLHDSEESSNSQIEFFLFISESWNPSWGGNKVYLKKGKSFIFPPRGNSLIIVKKDRQTNSFVQYINHLAGNNFETIIEGTCKA